MALVRNWRIFKFGGYTGEVRNQWKNLNLKGSQKIVVKFDPFRDDVKEIRDFNYWIFSYNFLKSNPNLVIKTEILTDRSEHSVTIDLINGEQIVMKCGNLRALDMFKLLHEHVTPLAPEEIKTTEIKKNKSDIFDEETWYIFVTCFVVCTAVVVFIVSRYVVLKPVD